MTVNILQNFKKNKKLISKKNYKRLSVELDLKVKIHLLN